MVKAYIHFNDLLGDGKEFVITPKFEKLSKQFKTDNKEYVEKSIRYESRAISDFREIYDDPIEYIRNMNTAYMNNEKEVCKNILDDIDGKSLDGNQRDAVVNDDYRQLVIAGAGSGKTLTLAAKVKYLVERKGVNPKDILLISFTRKAAEEMGERIRKLGIDIDSSTFHKYGLSIISKVNSKTPDIAENLNEYIDDYLNEIVYGNDELAKEFLTILGTSMLPIADENTSIGERILTEQRFDLTTIKGMYEAYKNKKRQEEIENDINDIKDGKLKPLEERLEKLSDYLKTEKEDNSLEEEKNEQTKREIEEKIIELKARIEKLKNEQKSIRNESMKSAEEVMLANIFFLDGISYVYEDEYKHDEKDNHRKKYRPDFHLIESDVYWEHFGIDKDGRTPQYTPAEEKKYIEGMEWKRNLHREQGTKLAETYSWQFRDNNIVQAVEANYALFGIKKHEVKYSDVVQEILKGDASDNIENFKALLSTFISLFKSYGYDIKKFKQFRAEVDKYTDESLSEEALNRRKDKEKRFLCFAEKFYAYYTKRLIAEYKIDFNDMITQATNLIEEGKYIPSYKYVIIDEYQDISVGRYKLVRATLEKSGAKLFCVGDDWQSIYRFSGGEVDLLVNFEKYFGLYSKTFIDKTYRNSQEILDISGAFIMRNDYQTAKKLKSDKHINDAVIKQWYSGKYKQVFENETDEVEIPITKAFIDVVDDIVEEYPEGDILVLGRNNGDIKDLLECGAIQVKQVGGETRIIVDRYPKIKITYLTVHRSKGLEADNVILLNMKNGKSGFPNQIVDDPVINLIRNVNETFPFAEERRLFYVAITRTRNRTYLLVPMSRTSRFIDDLDRLNGNIPSRNLEVRKSIACPECKVGTLVKRKGVGGKSFVSCSNYPLCTYTADDINLVRKNKRCPECGDFLVKKIGKYGGFWGCMHYPYCTYTENLIIENDNP